MSRVGHGDVRRSSVLERGFSRATAFAAAIGVADPTKHFDYMFADLHGDPANFLTPGKVTLDALKALALTMKDLAESPPVAGPGPGDSGIPAGYTYFGQFVDHDITFDEASASMEQLLSDDLQPLASLSGLRNSRSAHLDLDSVYGANASRDGAKLGVGRVSSTGSTSPPFPRPAGKRDANDLPRKPRDAENPKVDREALIGDPRNDENVVIAQLHTAFLKAHNTLVDQGGDFGAAQTRLRRLYQSVILTDFLARICDPGVHADVLANGPRFWRLAGATDVFMPAEFAAAGYRFGHSMIRTTYDFNVNFNPQAVPATLRLMFVFTALSGELGDFDTLPENWIIEWERFLDLTSAPAQRARAIDTQLTDFLFGLRDVLGQPEGGDSTNAAVKSLAPILAARNLLRGYLFRLPTGQAVARALGEPPLSGQALLDKLPAHQREAARPFAEATPLWFYILAEAGAVGGQRLGAVGSRIVAETFWNLIRHSADSILEPGGEHLPTQLADIIALAAQQDG